MNRHLARNVVLFAALGSPFAVVVAEAQANAVDTGKRAKLIAAVVPHDADRQFDHCVQKAFTAHKGGPQQIKHMACGTDFANRDKLSAQFVHVRHHDSANVTLEYSRKLDQFTLTVEEDRRGQAKDTQQFRLDPNTLVEDQALVALQALARAIRNVAARMAPPE